jgi:tRNA(Ile)-lysidine synthase
MSQDLFFRFREFIFKHELIGPKEKVILGVSGGPDSIFLLSMFSQLKNELGLDFIVAHLNHGLRAESDKEEEFVKQLCLSGGIKAVSDKRKINLMHKGDSLEQTARRVRYDFFSKIAREYKRKKLVLAHHKDDLAETVILRLLRGTGLKGLRGILPRTEYENLIVVRPLLDIEKREILDYLHQKGLEYRIDKSNFDQSFLRNQVRQSLMPELEKIKSSIKNNLCVLAKNAVRDYDFILQSALKNFRDIQVKSDSGGIVLDWNKLFGLHESLQYNIIRLSIGQAKGSLKRIDLKHIEEILKLIKQRPIGSVVDLPGVKVIKDRQEIRFIPVG